MWPTRLKFVGGRPLFRAGGYADDEVHQAFKRFTIVMQRCILSSIYPGSKLIFWAGLTISSAFPPYVQLSFWGLCIMGYSTRAVALRGP